MADYDDFTRVDEEDEIRSEGPPVVERQVRRIPTSTDRDEDSGKEVEGGEEGETVDVFGRFEISDDDEQDE